MARSRFIPKRLEIDNASLFGSSEEAWFWYCRAQVRRREGAQTRPAHTALPRPCEADDVYRAAVRLWRAGRIGPEHLRVMAVYGLLAAPPDARCHEQRRARRLWDEGLERLEPELRDRGIVW